MKVSVIFYSTYGHMYQMAQAAADGAKQAGAEVKLLQVPEVIPEETLKQIGAFEARKQFENVPTATVEDLRWPDAVVFGVPTRYGNMPGQFRNFFDQAGQLWMDGATIGKVATVMSSSGTQHGGQETTILTTQITLQHLGYIIVGLPYSYQGHGYMEGVSGVTPYGASTIVGPDGSRQPSDNELNAARFQAEHAAKIAGKLFD
ncbi:MAG: NAD(P)H:quinone oxidoreductase [Spirochaetales bacterium]